MTLFLRLFISLALLMLLFIGCESEEPLDVSMHYPSIATNAVSDVATFAAKCSITLLSSDKSQIDEVGICWATNNLPSEYGAHKTTLQESGTYTVTFDGLKPGTNYYVRAYVKYSGGMAYGKVIPFQTLGAPAGIGHVIDVEGNIYYTVKIGSQVWMKENLKTTKYKNDEFIDEAYAYDLDDFNAQRWGRLYTWNAAINESGVCPEGWHLPSEIEWDTLVNYAGGYKYAGDHLKATGQYIWSDYNAYATDKYGFTALPAGSRNHVKNFVDIEVAGHWWTSNAYENDYAVSIGMYSDMMAVSKSLPEKERAMSIRCIKDQE